MSEFRLFNFSYDYLLWTPHGFPYVAAIMSRYTTFQSEYLFCRSFPGNKWQFLLNFFGSVFQHAMSEFRLFTFLCGDMLQTSQRFPCLFAVLTRNTTLEIE